jgi:hypothetical protein
MSVRGSSVFFRKNSRTNSESVDDTIISAPMAWKSAIALLKARISVGQTTRESARSKEGNEVEERLGGDTAKKGRFDGNFRECGPIQM